MSAPVSSPGWSLADWLAREDRCSPGQALLLVVRLAAAVDSLHGGGRIHRAIDARAVMLDDQFQPHLVPPPPMRWFGGEWSDPESSPPELCGGEPIGLPPEIPAACDLLRRRGSELDPRRIDVYQLGALLCRVLTGEPVRAYLYSPITKAKVPPSIRPIIERSLGHDPGSRWSDCQPLLEALQQAVKQYEEGTEPSGPPLQGNSLHPAGQQTGAGQPADKDDPGGRLPFERLGQFRIVELLGRGGMGDVYKAYDESLDRLVAIKVLAPAAAADQEYVRRFHAEATAMAQLSHPNVVPVYFIGEQSGHHFFAMQYIEGESLAQRLARETRLPVTEAIRLAEQCLAGLEAAHAAGLIHRDIKPGNILLERATGRAILVDFGLARRLSDRGPMTSPGKLMGTVDYVAPEQIHGQPVDGRADLYSLGVVMYQMLSGSPPFSGESLASILFQHAYEAPRPLAQVAPEVPAELSAIVARLLRKNPDSRYQSASEVLRELRRFAPAWGAQTKPAAGLAPSQRRPGRRRVLIALGALCGLAAVAAALVGLERFWTGRPAASNGPSSTDTEGGPEAPDRSRPTSGAGAPGPWEAGKDSRRPFQDIPPGTWIDLLPHVDLARDRLAGTWTGRGDDVVHLAGMFSRVVLPVHVEGDYDLEVEFTRQTGDSGLSVLFPVGPATCTLWLSSWNGQYHGLELIDGKENSENATTRSPGTLVNGRRYRIRIGVRVAGELASVEVWLDGEPCTEWMGQISSLSVNPAFGPAVLFRPSLGAYASEFAFHRVRIKLAAGRAYLLFPSGRG